MFSALLIAGAIACSIQQTDYCNTNELTPIDLEELFEDDDQHREYQGIYSRPDKIIHFNGKPYFLLEEHPIPKSK